MLRKTKRERRVSCGQIGKKLAHRAAFLAAAGHEWDAQLLHYKMHGSRSFNAGRELNFRLIDFLWKIEIFTDTESDIPTNAACLEQSLSNNIAVLPIRGKAIWADSFPTTLYH